ncbi:DUF3892 domain-containing protein [Hydrogenoanaerobacterium saccharovorans]|uniref:DUF3892 domain-containing protein n=1 Tax=Hydrogenoanaerobacterium saccharovorans TaxID=474960 RepID=A0ABS2GJZ5_9FIRM|nr:DUF3892 domain-containing protein [Hydrogenoanaerobacterium saccharovorans]MBM6922815.1 DUF3892 domain-containing protein [Hydrogenoanaerobacterium saccharovorans]
MYYATKIKMEPGCHNSGSLLEIDSVYIEGCSKPGFFKKADLYDFLKKNPGTIKVKIWPYPHVTPAISGAGEKYVRSSPNYYTHDNLLDLPRE